MEKQQPKQQRGFRRRVMCAVGPITSVHQHARLMHVLSVGMALEGSEEEEEEWLAGRTLEALGLTLEQVLKDSKRSVAGQPPVYCSNQLGRKEADLRELLQVYENRLQWLAKGSRAWFGVVKTSSVALVVDCSNEALADEATAELHGAWLSRLLSEQLAKMSHISLVRYGSTVEACRPLDLQFDRQESLAVAAEWIDGCERGCGTSNLLSVLKFALKLKHVDTVCCVVASRPDQDHQVIEDFVLQSLVGHSKPHLHFVSFGCDPVTRQLMKTLIRSVGGSYHHNVMDEDGTFQDNSFDSVAAELKRIQNTLHEVQLLRAKSHGVPDTADSSSVEDTHHLQELTSPSHLAQLSFLTRPLADPDEWAGPTSDPFERLTSAVWLGSNNLRIRGLDFYQVLQPDTFCPQEERLPITGNTVRSQVYNVMLDVEWHDGIMRRVHVDVPKLDEYCEQLDDVMGVYQQRLQGLTLGSRKRFGVISEPNVILLVDTSSLVSSHLSQLQESLRKLLQEQFLSQDPAHQVVRRFNVVQYGCVGMAWQPQLVECSVDNLEEAWQWIAQWLCEGTRNLRSGIECVFGCMEWVGSSLCGENVGVYLISGGMPDQEEELICEAISRHTAGSSIVFNTVFFENDVQEKGEVLSSGRHGTPDQIADCLQRLAVAGGGRFHHFTLADLVCSDDITLVEEELDQARTCQQKVLQLLQRFDGLCTEQSKSHPRRTPADVTLSSAQVPQLLPLQPRHTLATAARLNLLSNKSNVKEGRGRGRGRGRCWSAPHNTPVLGFYLGKGLEKGLTVTGRRDRGSDRHTSLQERLLRDATQHASSREWLANHSLRALGLELDQYRVRGSGRGQPQVYLHPSKKGGVVSLRLSRVQLVDYVRGLKMAANVYNQRLKWLTSGSRHCFGCIAKNKLVLLLDSSASMAGHYSEMCAAVLELVVEQLIPRGASLNVVTFGGTIQHWQTDLTMATKDILVSLGNWLSSVVCCGNTRLLEAIQGAVDRFPACALHVVSDGHVDHSREFFFKRLSSLPASSIHTTSYHCSDRQHCCFLKELAERTNGRYYVYPASLTRSPVLQNTSCPQGHDVELMLQEIQCAERLIEETRDLVV